MKLTQFSLKSFFSRLFDLILTVFLLAGTAFFVIHAIKMLIWMNWWWAMS
jgi:hypothetical protein